MKPKMSLFQAAAKKYTSFQTDVKEAKKSYMEAFTAPVDSTDANLQAAKYAGDKRQDDKDTIQFSTIPPSNPGGSENSNKTESSSGGINTPSAPTPTAPGGTAEPNDLMKGLQVVTIGGKNYIVADKPDNYEFVNSQNLDKFKALQAAQDNFNKTIKENTTVITTEDVLDSTLKNGPLDFLSVLSQGSNSPSLSSPMTVPSVNDGTNVNNVKPVGDILVGEDEENEDAGLQVDEASAEPMTNTSSEISSPSDGMSSATSPSTGSDGSASSFMPTEEEEEVGNETQDNTTGVSSDYTTEKQNKAPEGNIGIDKNASAGAGEAEEKNSKVLGPSTDPAGDVGAGKQFTKGAGEIGPEDSEGKVGESEPHIGEAEIQPNDNQSPSGKDSAFWLPSDDLLGLKDIIGTSAKHAGVPDAQQTIGKDAAGNLVKKPTTPMHSVPNMRQYVKTGAQLNQGGPGNTNSLPQPVDISDLDGVMGMDSQNDRALNISMNFNF